jgi:2-polyprenyl-3-methyl-5-hydroxy-6-metoxy-1,4-benzoquinol methylase
VSDRTRFYDGIASDFDRIMNVYDVARRLEVVFDELLGGLDLRGRRVLDAGCGTGIFAARAQERGARVVALDLGMNLLKVARQKVGPRVVASDVTDLGLATASFDLVLSSECIEHTRSPRAAVREMIRVLRPGGSLVITCPNRFWLWSCVLANALGMRPYHGLENWPRWSELRGWVEENGVEIERHVGLHLFPFVLSASHPALRLLDRAGDLLGPIYVNQCLLGVKRQT